MSVLDCHGATLPKIVDSTHQFRVVYPSRMLLGRKYPRQGLGLAVAALVFAVALLGVVATAGASTGDIIAPSDLLHPAVDSGWQAGTCKEEPPESEDFCSVATPNQFFETAAGHPKWGFTQFIVKHSTEEVVPGEKLEKPVGEVATIRVDLPVGLSVNPGATEICPLDVF